MKSLLRLSFLLASLTLVGFMGLNGALDPAGVARVQAHTITIEATSDGNDTLTFGITAACDSAALAPGDQCVATVIVENTGEGGVEISDPILETSGTLFTCDIENNAGASWLEVTLTDYNPNDNTLGVGDTVEFDVLVNFAGGAGNPCQNQTALIVITINADCIFDDDDPDCGGDDDDEIDIVDEDDETPTTSSPPTSQVGGATTSQPPAPQTSFTAEVQPSRFPTTGSGGYLSDDMRSVTRWFFIGTGSIAATLFAISLLLWYNRREEDR